MGGDFGKQKAAIAGKFAKETAYNLQWFPEYVEEFPTALAGVPQPLVWQQCKFVPTAVDQVPDKFGVYCFAIDLGDPFPKKFHLPLYIGKASSQHLSGRFKDYLREKNNIKGREQIVIMLNKYQNKLTFWWAELPKVFVDVVEDHLIMCCNPPCNTSKPNKDRLWGKAF
jgi:hypothetical protein